MGFRGCGYGEKVPLYGTDGGQGARYRVMGPSLGHPLWGSAGDWDDEMTRACDQSGCRLWEFLWVTGYGLLNVAGCEGRRNRLDWCPLFVRLTAGQLLLGYPVVGNLMGYLLWGMKVGLLAKGRLLSGRLGSQIWETSKVTGSGITFRESTMIAVDN